MDYNWFFMCFSVHCNINNHLKVYSMYIVKKKVKTTLAILYKEVLVSSYSVCVKQVFQFLQRF